MHRSPLNESYVKEVSWLFQYLKEKPFDVRHYADSVMVFLADHGVDWHEDIDSIIGPTYTVAMMLEQWETDRDTVYAEDAFWDAMQDAFNRLSDSLRDTVVAWIAHDSPSEAPTWAMIELYAERLLPRETWLIHFSDNAADIAAHGFKYGAPDMERLALTTWHGTRQDFSGYNFAYQAVEDARYVREGTKYGTHAVMFQSSGVYGWHSGDEEPQTIFWGPAVRPQDMVFIHGSGSGWAVRSGVGRDYTKRDAYFISDDIRDVVKWVITNYRQYRRQITTPDIVDRISILDKGRALSRR